MPRFLDNITVNNNISAITLSITNSANIIGDININGNYLGGNSTGWNNTKTTVNSNSATWNSGNSAFITINSLSSDWNNTKTTVNSNSATWNSGSGSPYATYNYGYGTSICNNIVATLSGNCIGKSVSFGNLYYNSINGGINNFVGNGLAGSSGSGMSLAAYSNIVGGIGNIIGGSLNGSGNFGSSSITSSNIGGGNGNIIGNSLLGNTNANAFIANSNIAGGITNLIGGTIFNNFSSNGIINSNIAGGCSNAIGCTVSGTAQGINPFYSNITNSNIGGGTRNIIGCSVLGNTGGVASIQNSNIGGGTGNIIGCSVTTTTGTVAITNSFIGGGSGNMIGCSIFSNTLNGGVIGGGSANRVIGSFGNVVGGNTNISCLAYSNILGGLLNTSSGIYSNIVGGCSNTSLGYNSAILGGGSNTSSGCYSSIVGGKTNIASGNYSFIASGSANNTLGFSNTFILGSNLSASQKNYTYVNNLSSQGLIYDVNGSSNNWNNTYTNVNINSASWNNAYTTINTNSASWILDNSAYTTVNTNSTNWNYTYYANISSNPYILLSTKNSIYPINGNNISTGIYTVIVGGSANNDIGYSNIFILGSNLSASQINYTYVNNLSSQGIINSLGGNSTDWNTTRTTLNTNSATWNLQSPVNTINNGYINKIINGNMVVDQRNNGNAQLIVNNAPLAYTVDRFYAYTSGASLSGQQITTNGQRRYCFTGYPSVTTVGFGQRIESFNSYDLAGGTATLQAKIASSSLSSITWTAYYANTLDTFGTLLVPTKTLISTGIFYINNLESTYSTQITIPSASINGIEILFTAGSLLSAQTLTIGDMQLEAGNFVSTFERPNIRNSLMDCQRYFWKANLSLGSAIDTSKVSGGGLKLPVTMRIMPTITGGTYVVQSGSAGVVSNYTGVGTGSGVDSIFIYNGSNNWSAGVAVSFLGNINAEL